MAALLSLVMIVGFFSPVLPVRAEEETGLTAMGKSAETALPGGETKTSDTEFVWLDYGRRVTIRGNLWLHQYEQVGGDAIDFACRFVRPVSARSNG